MSDDEIRAQIAAEIEAHIRSQKRWTQSTYGLWPGMEYAAAIVRGNTPNPTPCDCGIECACATNRKDAS